MSTARTRTRPEPGGDGRIRLSWPTTIVVALLWVASPGCWGGGTELRDIGPQDLLDRAERQLEKGDELRAIETLTRITIDHPGVAYIDYVVYLLGSAHLEAHDFVEARASFQRLGRDYPFSEYADDALFLIGEASWQQVDSAVTDPEPALEARDRYQSFLREYPDSPLATQARSRLVEIDELLAEKKFKNAETYDRLGRPRAVVVYVERLIEEFPTTRVVPDGVLLMARAHHELGDVGEACAALTLLRSLPQSAERPDLVDEARSLTREWACDAALGTAEATR